MQRSRVQGLQQPDRHLLRDVTTRQTARPRGALRPRGRAAPALTCNRAVPEAMTCHDPVAGGRAGPQRRQGRGRRPQWRGARGQRGRRRDERDAALGYLHVGAPNV